MYHKKLHYFSNNYALNRRNVEENFLQTAGSLSNIRDCSIARKTLTRANFRTRTFHEFASNKRYYNPNNVTFSLLSPIALIPQSVVKIDAKDYGEYLFMWSVEVSSGYTSVVHFNPVVNGQNVGQGGYAVELPYKFSRATSGGVYVEEENDLRLEDQMAGSGSSTPAGSTPATGRKYLEDPVETVKAYDNTDPYRCLPERVRGQCQVSLDQGISWFGLQAAGSLDDLEERISSSETILVTKCHVVVNRVVR